MRTIVGYCSRSASYSRAGSVGNQNGLREVCRVDDDQLRTQGRGERDDEESDSNKRRMMSSPMECGMAFGPARMPAARGRSSGRP